MRISSQKNKESTALPLYISYDISLTSKSLIRINTADTHILTELDKSVNAVRFCLPCLLNGCILFHLKNCLAAIFLRIFIFPHHCFSIIGIFPHCKNSWRANEMALKTEDWGWSFRSTWWEARTLSCLLIFIRVPWHEHKQKNQWWWYFKKTMK